MLRVVISGTIDGEYDFPNDLFSGYCYEGWGNAWAMIDGIEAKYVPAQVLVANPERFAKVDILMAEFGQVELHAVAHKHKVFNIATESGAGFDVDRESSLEKKLDFLNRLSQCRLILSTTHAGKEYLSMFTNTPVLDIPLPMDLNKFRSRAVEKFDCFTVCIGEIIESCYDDRPLQLEALAIAKSVGAHVVASIGPQRRNFDVGSLEQLGFHNVEIYPHVGLYELSCNQLARSHVSMMIGQRSTFGRFVYVSWAAGVPSIATRYQCQERICKTLTFGCEQIAEVKEVLVKLRDDEKFYKFCREEGLENVRKHLSIDKIALRIVNEILPVYFSG